MRSSSLPFWFATTMCRSSGVGTAAWAWIAPPAPGDMRRHATGARVAPSKITTCPLATNDSTPCVWRALKKSMCGRTGVAPVVARQSAAVAPPRSRRAIGRADGAEAP